MKPKALMWRWIFFIISVFAAYGAFQWVSDPVTFDVPFTTSLYNHMFFTTTFAAFIFLMSYGILHKMFSSGRILERVRAVLSDFNMSCDENGRLILNPRPLNSLAKDSTPGSPSKTRGKLLEETARLSLGQAIPSSNPFRSSSGGDMTPQNPWRYS